MVVKFTNIDGESRVLVLGLIKEAIESDDGLLTIKWSHTGRVEKTNISMQSFMDAVEIVEKLSGIKIIRSGQKQI